ncbi:MAG: PIN domain-containing protein, partial [Candidatus Aenigmatarchaeota archaeon]
MVNYLFDTYALIEIIKNNPNYVRFMEESIATTRFNLVELLYIVMAEKGEAKAREVFSKFKDAEIEVPDDILVKAMKFRLDNKKKNLSYVDCIGYMTALENKIRFLTGDSAFKDMPNVEFAK